MLPVDDVSANQHVVVVVKAKLRSLLRVQGEKMDVSEAVASDYFQLFLKVAHGSDGEHRTLDADFVLDSDELLLYEEILVSLVLEEALVLAVKFVAIAGELDIERVVYLSVVKCIRLNWLLFLLF